MTTHNTTTTNNNNKTDEITPEASKRICTHMNEDHGLSIYAMAKRVTTIKPGWKLTDARIQSVSLTHCQLQAFVCRGDLCEMMRVNYPFQPPLQSSSQVRPRMVEIHNQVLSPQWTWLVTRPLALATMILLGAMGYFVVGLGQEETLQVMQESELVNSHMINFFGSLEFAYLLMQSIFWFSVVAHAVEAIYAVYSCRTTLKLGVKGQVMWGIVIGLGGIFILDELTALLKVASSKKADKKE